MSKDKSESTETVKQGFTRAQLLRSRQFTLVSKDVLAVVLEDGQRYTIPEVKRLSDAWLKKEAK